MRNVLQRFTAVLTTVCFTLTSSLLPAANAFASSCGEGEPSDVCAVLKVGNTVLPVPKLQYIVTNTATVTPQGGFDTRLLSGKSVQVNLNQAASILQIDSSKVAEFVNSLPSSSSIVLGRYSPQSNELRVDIVKVQKSGNTVTVSEAPFTPLHGNFWAAQRTYMTASDRMFAGPGKSPFARYVQSDAFFHGLSFTDSTAVLGSAMRYSNSTMSVLSIASSRFTQRTEEGGNWLRKKVTTIVEGFTKPIWYIGLPVAMQPDGLGGAICAGAESYAPPLVCPVEYRVLPFATFTKWDGGSMPTAEAKVYNWQQTKSSWSVLAMAIFFTVLSFAGGEFFALASGTAGTTTGIASGLLGAGFESVGIAGADILVGSGVGAVATAAAVDGLSYLVAETVIDGGAGVTSPQATFGGAVGTQVLAANVPTSEQGLALYNIDRGTQILSRPGQSVSYNSSHGVVTQAGMTTSQFDQGNNMVKPDVSTVTDFNQLQYVTETK